MAAKQYFSAKKILLIEDSKLQAVGITQKLKEIMSPLEVNVVETGEEGINKAKEERPDLIILDMILPDPDMDGYKVCERLKTQEETKDITVLMTSGLKTDLDDLVEGRKKGAVLYIPKDKNFQYLVNAVKLLLEKNLF